MTNHGSIITDIIEENTIKSIVKKEVSRLSIIGNGILRSFSKIKLVLDVLEKNKMEVLELNVTESKISIMFKDTVNDKILNEIHEKLIEK